jgi:hypothetical protein
MPCPLQQRDQDCIRAWVSVDPLSPARMRFPAGTHLQSRVGALNQLESLMRDSPVEQPAVVQQLSAFVRTNAPKPLTKEAGQPITCPEQSAPEDVQEALTMLGRRDPAHDGKAVIDLKSTCLANVRLPGALLSGADFQSAFLDGAILRGADLTGACFRDTSMRGADFGRRQSTTRSCAGLVFTVRTSPPRATTSRLWFLVLNRIPVSRENGGKEPPLTHPAKFPSASPIFTRVAGRAWRDRGH